MLLSPNAVYSQSVTLYTNPQQVTNIFNKSTIPSYSVLQLWKSQLQQHSEDSSQDGQYYYIEVRDCRYDMECIDQMLALHKARDIRSAVEKELEWFAGQLIMPKSVLRCPSSDSLKKFQHLVFHQKWDEELNNYGMSGEELVKICCDRWLSHDIINWMLNLMNQSQEDTLCIYHDPHHPGDIDKKYIQECLDKRKQSPSSLFVVFNVGCTSDKVCFSSEMQPGCSFSFCNITRQDDCIKAVYGDSLGWSVPDNLQDILSGYFEAVFKYKPSNLEITCCHDPKQNTPDKEHTCANQTCAQMFPLQRCASISGVVTLIMAALACFKRNIFDLLTTTHSPQSHVPSFAIHHVTNPSSNAKYLRRVLATWVADREICVDYLIPRNFGIERNDEEEVLDEIVEERSSSVDHGHNVSNGDGSVSCQQDSHQDQSNATNVQFNGTSLSNNSEQHGATTESLETNETSTPNDQKRPTESSTSNHICLKCSYNTRHTFNMKRHFKRNHPDITFTPQLAHTCPSCSFGSNRSTDIGKHVNECHPGVKWAPPILRRGPKAKEGPKRHKCPQCQYQSNSKHNINRHQQSCHETMHTLESSRVGKCQCLECGQRLYKISDLRRHLSTKHAFIFKTETVVLDSYEEFDEWKASIEIAEGCSFTKTTGDKVIQGGKRTQYYQCNRSGMFRSNNKGKRRQKWQGSCKIESNCTSTMIASILENGKVEVECVCTHYSHQIELQHVWIPKGSKRQGTVKSSHRDQTREEIGTVKSSRQTREEIMKDVCNSVGNVYDRHHTLSKQEIPDIVDVFVASTIQRQSNDKLSLLSWMKQWAGSIDPSPILTYRIEGNSDDFDFPGLQHDDFIIVIQSELQKDMMLKFCANGACCDSTEVSSKFTLTTLQVVDDIGQTLPVAWCISHTKTLTTCVADIFFSTLKKACEACEDLVPAWFMSPWPGHLHNSWTSVFDHTPRRLICPWSVDKAWADMLKKTIGNASIESRVHKLLKILLEQTEQTLFEDHLQTLLERLSVSAKTQEFCRYFLTQWVSRKNEWTYCNNKGDTFPPTIFTEPFYQRFHYEYSQENISERLDTCVFHLLKYARDCLVNRCISLTKGKLVTQGEDMQGRHDAGIAMGEVCLRACPDDSHRLVCSSIKGKLVTQGEDMQGRHDAGIAMGEVCLRACPDDSHRLVCSSIKGKLVSQGEDMQGRHDAGIAMGEVCLRACPDDSHRLVCSSIKGKLVSQGEDMQGRHDAGIAMGEVCLRACPDDSHRLVCSSIKGKLVSQGEDMQGRHDAGIAMGEVCLRACPDDSHRLVCCSIKGKLVSQGEDMQGRHDAGIAMGEVCLRACPDDSHRLVCSSIKGKLVTQGEDMQGRHDAGIAMGEVCLRACPDDSHRLVCSSIKGKLVTQGEDMQGRHDAGIAMGEVCLRACPDDSHRLVCSSIKGKLVTQGEDMQGRHDAGIAMGEVCLRACPDDSHRLVCSSIKGKLVSQGEDMQGRHDAGIAMGEVCLRACPDDSHRLVCSSIKGKLVSQGEDMQGRHDAGIAMGEVCLRACPDDSHRLVCSSIKGKLVSQGEDMQGRHDAGIAMGEVCLRACPDDSHRLVCSSIKGKLVTQGEDIQGRHDAGIAMGEVCLRACPDDSHRLVCSSIKGKLVSQGEDMQGRHDAGIAMGEVCLRACPDDSHRLVCSSIKGKLVSQGEDIQEDMMQGLQWERLVCSSIKGKLVTQGEDMQGRHDAGIAMGEVCLRACPDDSHRLVCSSIKGKLVSQGEDMQGRHDAGIAMGEVCLRACPDDSHRLVCSSIKGKLVTQGEDMQGRHDAGIAMGEVCLRACPDDSHRLVCSSIKGKLVTQGEDMQGRHDAGIAMGEVCLRACPDDSHRLVCSSIKGKLVSQGEDMQGRHDAGIAMGEVCVRACPDDSHRLVCSSVKGKLVTQGEDMQGRHDAGIAMGEVCLRACPDDSHRLVCSSIKGKLVSQGVDMQGRHDAGIAMGEVCLRACPDDSHRLVCSSIKGKLVSQGEDMQGRHDAGNAMGEVCLRACPDDSHRLVCSSIKGKLVSQGEDMQGRHDAGIAMGEVCLRACPDDSHRLVCSSIKGKLVTQGEDMQGRHDAGIAMGEVCLRACPDDSHRLVCSSIKGKLVSQGEDMQGRHDAGIAMGEVCLRACPDDSHRLVCSSIKGKLVSQGEDMQGRHDAGIAMGEVCLRACPDDSHRLVCSSIKGKLVSQGEDMQGRHDAGIAMGEVCLRACPDDSHRLLCSSIKGKLVTQGEDIQGRHDAGIAMGEVCLRACPDDSHRLVCSSIKGKLVSQGEDIQGRHDAGIAMGEVCLRACPDDSHRLVCSSIKGKLVSQGEDMQGRHDAGIAMGEVCLRACPDDSHRLVCSSIKGKLVTQGEDMQGRHDAGIAMGEVCVRACPDDSHRLVCSSIKGKLVTQGEDMQGRHDAGIAMGEVCLRACPDDSHRLLCSSIKGKLVSQGEDMQGRHDAGIAMGRLVCSSIKGKLVSQGEDMQGRHDAGIAMGEVCLRACPDDSHRWDIIEANQVLYTVQESASICKNRKCAISCLQCQICIHQYICTCIDNLTNITICKHIHLVHTSIHKDQGSTQVRDTQWLKDRIQSRVHRLLAVVNSTGNEHFSVLQELDSKLGVCSSVLDSRLLWGATNFVQPRQDMASQSGAGGLVRKEKKRRSIGVDGVGVKKKHKKQDIDAGDGKDEGQVAVSSLIPVAVPGSTIQDGSAPLNQPITTIPPVAEALIPIHVTSPQEIPSIQEHTHTAHHMNIPPAVLTSDPSIVITSEPHTSQPAVMTSHIELQTSQQSSIMSYPTPRTIMSTPQPHPHPHQFSPLPHQPIIHTPGSSGSIPHTHHPQLSGIPSYQTLRPVLPSQLSPGTAQQMHMDFHQAVRPLGHVESQQLATMSDEQLTTLAGVASALFGDSLECQR
ncbi:uncharacterized protein [Amphiura filiformis]|uniref:uncharacterized protein n=1 Tax=Amphiura filiformis TaxID=82378 RepID=UPI003B20E9E6